MTDSNKQTDMQIQIKGTVMPLKCVNQNILPSELSSSTNPMATGTGVVETSQR